MSNFGVAIKKRAPLYCSFCGKEHDEVGYLVAGPVVFICNECVELCREIGQNFLCETQDVQHQATESGATPTKAPS